LAYSVSQKSVNFETGELEIVRILNFNDIWQKQFQKTVE